MQFLIKINKSLYKHERNKTIMTQAEATFSISTNFCFKNTVESNNISLEHSPNIEEAKKILEFNDLNNGEINYSFLDWALKNNISYESIWWFVVNICGNNDAQITSTVNTLFNRYKIYFDETNNCIKFKFKDSSGKTNAQWYNDFVLGGIVFTGDTCPIDTEELFSKFNIQKSALDDPKLKHIAPHKGEDKDRLLTILKSKNLSILLQTLYDTKNVYLHWTNQNLLFYSLVDIIDSISDDVLYNIYLKNLIYNAAIHNQDIMCILAKYDYPNIKEDAIKEFCLELKEWFIAVRNTDNMSEYEHWSYLISKIKKIKTKDDLLFITDNEDYLLIDNFVPLYSLRIQTFANSELYFDECGIVQEKIDSFTDILCTSRRTQYAFLNSRDDKLLGISDMVIGLTGALMAYLNTHSINRIKMDFSKLSTTQKENLRLFFKIRLKSSLYNMFFDHSNIIESTKVKCDLITNLLGIDKRYIII